jgi:hypothetical protein
VGTLRHPAGPELGRTFISIAPWCSPSVRGKTSLPGVIGTEYRTLLQFRTNQAALVPITLKDGHQVPRFRRPRDRLKNHKVKRTANQSNEERQPSRFGAALRRLSSV